MAGLLAGRRWSRRRVIAASCAASIGTRIAPSITTANGPECVTLEAFPVRPGDRPHDVAPAAGGKGVWYTAQRAGALGLLDPLTGDIKLVGLGDGSAPHGVIVGPDGGAWVTDGGRDEIQRVDPSSHAIDRFSVGRSNANLNTAAFDGQGALWFTGQSGVIGRLEPNSGSVATVDSPRGRGPYGICARPQGDVWFVSLAGSYLGALAWREEEIIVSAIEPPTATAGLRRVWSDSGGVLWITGWNTGQLASFDPKTEEWREWPLPGDAPRAYAVYVDDADIVWVTDFGGDAIVRFDPATEQFDVYPNPHPGGSVRQLLGRPGEVWGAESGADHLIVARTVCAGP